MTGYTFNFLKILQQLQFGQENPNDSWVSESYKNPKKFWKDLFNYYTSQLSVIPKSYPFEHYDFYHDIVLRNFRSERIAFRWYEEGKGWQSISFAQLYNEVEGLAQTWASYGAKAGQVVCVVLPLGVQYILALLTTLKMGLVFSYLPPLGDQFLAKRLKNLAPNFIISDFTYQRLLGDFQKLLLEKQEYKPTTFDPISHSYASGEAMAHLFSPLSKNSHHPIILSADKAYLHAMRDGVTTFFLRPEDAIMSPGFCTWQFQPALLLATWLLGATYVHLDLAILEKKPELLREFSLRSLGVSTQLLDILIRTEQSIELSVNYIFRNCAEPLHWPKWKKLSEKSNIKDIPIQNILGHAGFGGMLLTSWPSKDTFTQEVYPTMGSEWQLTHINLSGQVVHDLGLYTTEQEEDKTPLGTLLLARNGDRWLYFGSYEPRHSARSYPRQEVLEIVSTLPFVQQADCISVGNQDGAFHVILIFVGAYTQEECKEKQKEWMDEIHANLLLHLGREFFPDKIEIYPLYARMNEENVDHDWCLSQYLRGYLYRKSQHPIYQLLTKLKSL